MKYLKFVFYLGVLSIFIGCSQENTHDILLHDSTPPAQIIDPQVKNLAGGAEITYAIPKGGKLDYIVAKVTDKNGEVKEFSSSFYSNSVRVEGLSDSGRYTVSIYSYNRSEDRSEPVLVEIDAKEPSYKKAFKTLELSPDFGGINVKMENVDNANLGIIFLSRDSTGVFGFSDSYFSAVSEVNQTFRPYPDELSTFGVLIKDQWGHTSDTVTVNLKPLFEKKLEKDLWRAMHLDNDSPPNHTTSYYQDQIALENLWDGKWSVTWDDPIFGDGTYYNRYLTNDPRSGVDASWFTIDLGQVVHLSRYRINNSDQFAGHYMKKFEIWGMESSPSQSGNWDEWTLLETHVSVKPSGLPEGQYSQEDKDDWAEGQIGNFPPGSPAVRYIRIKCLENYAGHTNMELNEVTFWGR